MDWLKENEYDYKSPENINEWIYIKNRIIEKTRHKNTRMKKGRSGLTLMSCDNVQMNGNMLKYTLIFCNIIALIWAGA